MYPTPFGAPQGGVISPTLAVMALAGLERKLISPKEIQKDKEKINVIAYADDFVVTASSEQLLQEKVMPILKDALQEVGLELSAEKTRITPINKGFDFLGFNVRKYKNGKLLIKPSKASIKRFLKEIRSLIKANIALPTHKLIYLLNPKITGWTNYYRSVVSSRVFATIDDEIFWALTRWSQKRHTNKGKKWIVNKYYTCVNNNRWRFYCTVKDKEGKNKSLYLRLATETHIWRHKKIVAKATPFDPKYKEYFIQRDKERKACIYFSTTAANSTGLRYIQPY